MTIITNMQPELRSRDFSHFTPHDYLNEYYAAVIPENDKLLRFFAEVADEIPQGVTLLEYGGGPTIYQLISFAPKVNEVHFTDYLQENVDAVQDWTRRETHAHDWTPFVEVALEHELGRKPNADEVHEREELVRRVLSFFGRVDAFNRHNDKLMRSSYDVVSTSFVAESIASSYKEWEVGINSITEYVNRGGYLIMTAIRNATYWKSGDKHFPAFAIGPSDIIAELEKRGFRIELLREIDADQTKPDHPDYEGYDGMVFVLARKLR